MKELRKCTSCTERKIPRQKRTVVAIAKDRAYKYWSESLQSNKGRAKIFKIAN